jgi:hypothetical protein
MARQIAIGLGVVLIFCAAAQADTVYFTDGTKLDGAVTRPNPNSVAITVGKGRMVFPVTQVARVEENDKAGIYDLNEYRARQHNDIMQQRTGLTREQRDEVRKLVTELENADPRLQKAARDNLLVYNKTVPVFKYLESCLPYMRGQRVPEMMEVMCAIDPKRAEQVLMQRSQDVTPLNRAKALELIGATMKEKGVERIAQGLVDQDSEIQIAAANTLGSVGDRGASYALLKGLESSNERVRNASLNALAKLWSTESTKVEFETASQWREYVDARRGQLEKVVDAAKLEPLIKVQPGEEPIEYVDE